MSKSQAEVSSDQPPKTSTPSTSDESATSPGTSDGDKVDEVRPASVTADQGKVDETVHHQYDGMPSFDEWKKMMLAEQERGGYLCY